MTLQGVSFASNFHLDQKHLKVLMVLGQVDPHPVGFVRLSSCPTTLWTVTPGHLAFM